MKDLIVSEYKQLASLDRRSWIRGKHQDIKESAYLTSRFASVKERRIIKTIKMYVFVTSRSTRIMSVYVRNYKQSVLFHCVTQQSSTTYIVYLRY